MEGGVAPCGCRRWFLRQPALLPAAAGVLPTAAGIATNGERRALQTMAVGGVCYHGGRKVLPLGADVLPAVLPLRSSPELFLRWGRWCGPSGGRAMFPFFMISFLIFMWGDREEDEKCMCVLVPEGHVSSREAGIEGNNPQTVLPNNKTRWILKPNTQLSLLRLWRLES
jgi:hypothetical protein